EIAQGKFASAAVVETVAVENVVVENISAERDVHELAESVSETFAPEIETEPEAVSQKVESVEDPEDSIRLIAEETFLEEAEEILESTHNLLKQWFDQRSDRSLLLQLQRAAHSLKGGARMIENEPVAAISYQLETTFEQFAVHHFNSNVYDLLLQTTFAWLKQAIFERDYSNFDSLKLSL